MDADSYALKLLVFGASEPPRQLLLLVAQIADLRVVTAWAGPADAVADSAALDVTFRDAVLHVRRAAPR